MVAGWRGVTTVVIARSGVAVAIVAAICRN